MRIVRVNGISQKACLCLEAGPKLDGMAKRETLLVLYDPITGTENQPPRTRLLTGLDAQLCMLRCRLEPLPNTTSKVRLRQMVGG